jgi:hypothetical protein
MVFNSRLLAQSSIHRWRVGKCFSHDSKDHLKHLRSHMIPIAAIVRWIAQRKVCCHLLSDFQWFRKLHGGHWELMRLNAATTDAKWFRVIRCSLDILTKNSRYQSRIRYNPTIFMFVLKCEQWL